MTFKKVAVQKHCRKRGKHWLSAFSHFNNVLTTLRMKHFENIIGKAGNQHFSFRDKDFPAILFCRLQWLSVWTCLKFCFNSLPNDKILDWTILKAFVDNKIKVTFCLR